MLRYAHRAGIAGIEEVVQALEGLGDAVVATAENFGVFLRGFQVPCPGVLECLDLCVPSF